MADWSSCSTALDVVLMCGRTFPLTSSFTAAPHQHFDTSGPAPARLARHVAVALMLRFTGWCAVVNTPVTQSYDFTYSPTGNIVTNYQHAQHDRLISCHMHVLDCKTGGQRPDWLWTRSSLRRCAEAACNGLLACRPNRAVTTPVTCNFKTNIDH